MSVLGDVGTRLQQARKNASISKMEAARQLGIATSTLYDIEHGLNPVGVVRLVKMCRMYGVEPQQIIVGTVDSDDDFTAALDLIREGSAEFQSASEKFKAAAELLS